jgi:hypothetical protein
VGDPLRAVLLPQQAHHVVEAACTFGAAADWGWMPADLFIRKS